MSVLLMLLQKFFHPFLFQGGGVNGNTENSVQNDGERYVNFNLHNQNLCNLGC